MLGHFLSRVCCVPARELWPPARSPKNKWIRFVLDSVSPGGKWECAHLFVRPGAPDLSPNVKYDSISCQRSFISLGIYQPSSLPRFFFFFIISVDSGRPRGAGWKHRSEHYISDCKSEVPAHRSLHGVSEGPQDLSATHARPNRDR